jgi:NADH-quinone oxidoreductase subunit F
MYKTMGIGFETGKALGKDITIDSLKAEGYAAIFVGVGAHKGMDLNIPGEQAEGVMSALTLLKDVYDNKPISIGKKVVVIGGGFTAVDAARSAKRLGATDVLIAYRRTKDEMPATPEEIAEAEAEGIKVMYLVAPKAIETADGKVSGIRMINQVLGDKDQSNRRRPEEYSGAEFVLPCDLIITAIGQKPVTQTINGLQTTKSGMILADPATGATSVEGVFAGGDVINVDSVISSIAAGKKGAASIDKMLAGDQAVLEYEPDVATVEKEKVLRRVGYFKDNELTKVEINGNGESIYFLVDGNTISGINHSKCAKIEATIENGKVVEITDFGNPDGYINPPKIEKPDDLRLDGFSWLDQLRPKQKSDIFNK